MWMRRDGLREVMGECVGELEGIGLSFSGGVSGARATLEGAISAAAAEALRVEIGRSSQSDAWARLSEIDSDRLVAVLAEESVEIGAVALSKLKVGKAAEILGKLPGEKARRMAYAMGQTGSVAPHTVQQIGRALMERFDAEPPVAFAGGPVERVGAILNFSAAATRDDVLDALDKEDKGFADEVRKAIFTFANIPERVDPRDVPKVIREVEADVLATALQAATADERDAKVPEFIFANMSQRLAAQLKDDMEAKGKVKSKDAEAAQSDVVSAIRDMETRGEIMLVVEEEE